MLLAEKFLWSCLLSIAIIFSLGASFMITQNHRQLLLVSTQQYKNTHSTQSYSLESKLLQDSVSVSTNYGSDENAMEHRATYYLDQFLSFDQQHQASYVLVNEQGTLLYSNAISKQFMDTDLFQDSKQYHHLMIDGTPTFFITSEIEAGNIKYYLTSCYNLSSIYQERDRQYQSFLLIDMGMLVISFLIIRFLSTHLTKPIHKLNDISRRIAQGNYAERTNFTSKDEIGELSKSFDEMASINEQTIATLKQNLEKQEVFMGSFSHEIKTPMTAIIGFADMLRSYQCDEATIQKSANFIYTEGKRLEDLSYNLMELLSLSSTQIQRIPVPIENTMMQLQSYYQASSLQSITFTYDSAILMIHENLLFTLLRNLIDNALKASGDKPIVVQGILHKNRYEISVIDHGIGMSEEQIHQALLPFYMADKSRSRTQGGAGLGLSICSRIAQLHQSQIIIDSSLGQGTIIRLPLEVVS